MLARMQLLFALLVAFSQKYVDASPSETSQHVMRKVTLEPQGLAIDETTEQNDDNDDTAKEMSTRAAAQEQMAETKKMALATQLHSASSTHAVCNNKYECTWLSTGCPNVGFLASYANGGGWWSFQSKATVMTDMYNYCDWTAKGTATPSQRNGCCGDGVACTPTCTFQTAWVLPSEFGKFPKTQCMSKLLCYDEIPPEKMNNNTWKCMCLLPPHSEEARYKEECSDYFDCIEEKHAAQTDSFEEVLKAIQDLSGSAGGGALADLGKMRKEMRGQALEASEQTCEDSYSPSSSCSYWKGMGYCTSTYVSWMETNCHKTCGYCSEDEPECRVPESMDIEAIDCACGATLRAECEAKGESEKQTCWRGVLCTNTNVCNSWQMKHCSEEERSYQMLLELKVDPEFLFNSSDQATPDGTALEESILDKRSC